MKRLHFILNSLTVRCMSTSHPCTKSAGRPKASEVEARTQELIDAAGMLFLKNGYTKVSLEAIARQARVAVRTIYVKFGGKAGLLKAVLASRRQRSFDEHAMETDSRPVRIVIDEFARQFHALLWSPESIAMQRVIVAEASTNPELAEAFYEGGPRLTREMLGRYFARPDVRCQLRDDLPLDLLPAHLIGCINGDAMCRFLFAEGVAGDQETQQKLAARLELFYYSVLKHP